MASSWVGGTPTRQPAGRRRYKTDELPSHRRAQLSCWDPSPSAFFWFAFFAGRMSGKRAAATSGPPMSLRTSPALGVLTLLLDALKGSAAVMVALALSRGEFLEWAYANVPWTPDHSWTALSPVVAVRACCCSFRDSWPHVSCLAEISRGKGRCHGTGIFRPARSQVDPVAIGVFVAVVLVFRYVSLGSIVAVALFPVLAWLLHDYDGSPQILALMAIASVLIIAKHHQNIRRLLAGTEPRFKLWRRSSMSRIAVIGAGAWGTGLAIVLGRRRRSSGAALGARERSSRFDLDPSHQ